MIYIELAFFLLATIAKNELDISAEYFEVSVDEEYFNLALVDLYLSGSENDKSRLISIMNDRQRELLSKFAN